LNDEFLSIFGVEFGGGGALLTLTTVASSPGANWINIWIFS